MEKRTDSRDRGRKAEGAPKCDADGAHLTENLQTFFDTVKDFLFVLDMNGRIRHVNRTVTDRLGHTEDDLRGVSVLEVHPPDRRDEAGRIVQAMLRNDVEYCPVPLMTATG
ncbi:MAG: PAS domain-containing protein, partial [Candidatus Pacebacteria bacterium]|nr:PAS domain-containing protein [Candidatus Paceibacterota bacterium]